MATVDKNIEMNNAAVDDEAISSVDEAKICQQNAQAGPNERESNLPDGSDLSKGMAVGFLHNVSPVKKGRYFDFQLQTKSKTIRGVCFSPPKRKIFTDFGASEKPVKVQRFEVSTSSNAEDLVMGRDVIVEEFAEPIDFKKEELPTNVTASTMKSVCIGQVISMRAKVYDIGRVKIVSQNLEMAEAHIVDPTGTIKLILWGKFTSMVEKGKTYLFHQIRVKKDSLTQEVFVNTAKEGTIISETEAFTEVLPITTEASSKYAETTAEGDILGVTKLVSYLSCSKCSKKVGGEKSIIECRNCKMKQRMASCMKHWYAHVLFQHDGKKVELTFFEDIIREILEQKSWETVDVSLVEEAQLTEALLTTAHLQLTYNNQSKVATKVVMLE